MIYTKAILHTYNLLQLRDIARDMGVKAPTTKKSKELIDSIMSIQEGRLQPDFSPRPGRKPKGRMILLEERDKGELRAELIEKFHEINAEYFNKISQEIESIKNEYSNKINELFINYLNRI